MVTVTDLIGAILGRLQSGETTDADPLVVMREDGSLLVDGALPIEDVRELLGGGALPDRIRSTTTPPRAWRSRISGASRTSANISTGTAGASKWSTSTDRASTSCCCSACRGNCAMHDDADRGASRERGLRAILDGLAEGEPDDLLALGDLLSGLGRRAFGMLLFVCVLPAFIPIPIGGAISGPSDGADRRPVDDRHAQAMAAGVHGAARTAPACAGALRPPDLARACTPRAPDQAAPDVAARRPLRVDPHRPAADPAGAAALPADSADELPVRRPAAAVRPRAAGTRRRAAAGVAAGGRDRDRRVRRAVGRPGRAGDPTGRPVP